jgi:hypothetical protein
MVPNHTGIFSRWVLEHPDWFIQSDYPPFPGYCFNGEDLSQSGDVRIQIEDGYWNRSDAAVVFRLVERASGRTRYIYHGNDGTSMPWNDTAQLNYLLPDVREAVIQTILHVARNFPIIRFDAAMTLAKKHFQRSGFPSAAWGRHPLAGRARHEPRGVRCRFPGGVLARGGGPRGRRGARHAAAGRGLLADGGVLSSAPWACTGSTTAPS